jgi:hypothetical protein
MQQYGMQSLVMQILLSKSCTDMWYANSAKQGHAHTSGTQRLQNNAQLHGTTFTFKVL